MIYLGKNLGSDLSEEKELKDDLGESFRIKMKF